MELNNNDDQTFQRENFERELTDFIARTHRLYALTQRMLLFVESERVDTYLEWFDEAYGDFEYFRKECERLWDLAVGLDEYEEIRHQMNSFLVVTDMRGAPPMYAATAGHTAYRFWKRVEQCIDEFDFMLPSYAHLRRARAL